MKITNLLKILLIFYIFLTFLVTENTFAQEIDVSSVQKTYEGVVRRVIEESKNTSGGYYQELEVEIIDKDQNGKILNVENGSYDTPVSQKYIKGDTLILMGFQDEDGSLKLYVSDYVRRGQLLSLFFIFIILSVIIAGKRGITSFVGMVITFFIIFSFVLPKISSGSSPINIILLFSVIAIPVTFYLSHGLNTKTTVAIIGTIISLAITVILSAIYVGSAKLTGYTTDEASFLQIIKGGNINMQGILLAGIIIGFLGVLDDITVSQSAIVFQLKNVNRKLKYYDLFKRSMDVGKDHIASMINTLILVYTGASLPLLLLFTDTSKTFNEVVNYEIISSEIIRTLLGSIGLILAVPITTAIAAFFADTMEGGDKR